MTALDYATTPDGAQVAYRVLADTGERAIVYVPGAVYPIESIETDPPYAQFVQGLSELGRLIVAGRQGVGASDPLDFDRDVYAVWADGLVAILDTEQIERANIVGYAAGATAALEMASRHPDRVDSVVALHAVINVPGSAGTIRGIGDVMAATVARDADAADAIRQLLMPSRAGDPGYRAWNIRAGQLGASPHTAERYWEAVLGTVNDLPERLRNLPTPVLIVHRRDNQVVAVEWSEQLAAILPEGQLIVVEGADLIPNAGDVDALVAEIAHFLIGEHRLPATHRPIRTLLFTDIVDSTETVEAVGDARWRSVLDDHDEVVQHSVTRHGGTVVKSTGDGTLATFANATRALAGAVELRDALHELGLEVRMGLHVGEVDIRGDDVAGVAVHLASRVMGHAGPGEIVTSAAVPLVAAGGSCVFEPIGPRELRGLDGSYDLSRLGTA